jgi:hypothetical protein
MRRGFLPLIASPFMLPLLIIVLAAVVLLPMLAITLSPELKLLFQVAAAIMIYSWVRNTVGPGILSFGIAGVLIYIFVFLLPQLTLGMYMIWTFMGLGLFSVVFWGLTLFRKA